MWSDSLYLPCQAKEGKCVCARLAGSPELFPLSTFRWGTRAQLVWRLPSCRSGQSVTPRSLPCGTWSGAGGAVGAPRAGGLWWQLRRAASPTSPCPAARAPPQLSPAAMELSRSCSFRAATVPSVSRCSRRCLGPAGSSCRRRREPGRTGSRRSWHRDPARLSGCDLPSVAPNQPPCPELVSKGELPACPAGHCHVPSAHMLVCVSLGCAGSTTSGTRAQQSCRCVTVPGLQGDTASPALGHPTVRRAVQSSEGRCLWLGCLGLFLLPWLSASPGCFCSSEGRKQHPQPLKDAVSVPPRLRLCTAVGDPSVVGWGPRVPSEEHEGSVVPGPLSRVWGCRGSGWCWEPRQELPVLAVASG